MHFPRLFLFCAFAAALMNGGVAVAGESEGKDDHIPTVQWFTAPENAEALKVQLEKCRDNPGALEKTPVCQNAMAAENWLFANKPASTLKWRKTK